MTGNSRMCTFCLIIFIFGSFPLLPVALCLLKWNETDKYGGSKMHFAIQSQCQTLQHRDSLEVYAFH